MMKFVPRYILGTQAFLAIAVDPLCELKNWFESRTSSSLRQSGIGISLATVQALPHILSASTNPAWIRNSNTLLKEFERDGCIVDIRHAHHHAHQLFSHIFNNAGCWTGFAGGKMDVPDSEKLIFGAALCGQFNAPIWLVDLEQDIHKSLMLQGMTKIVSLPRPQAIRYKDHGT